MSKIRIWIILLLILIVFMRYGLAPVIPDEINATKLYQRDIQELIWLTPGGLIFSAEDIMRYIFWKSERAKRRNKKKTNAWKYYNLTP